jgi:predicted nucleic acid-binding protein
MKAVLDACVLYPSVLREILQGVAAKGLIEPLWSDRILREWTRATTKLGPQAQAQSEYEAAQFRAAFPRGHVREHQNIESRLALPDPNDVHVLAVAIAGNADCIVTFNAKDFPRHLLAEEGVERRDPDGLLWQLWSFHPAEVTDVVTRTHAKAESILGEPIDLKKLLKRAQLPRLAKAILASP